MTTSVHSGYLKEQLAYQAVCTSILLWEIYQFCLWKSPKQSSKVKILQKNFVTANFFQNIVLFILNLDVRSAWGIYNPIIVLTFAFGIIQIPVYASIIWLREVSKVNARSSAVSNRKKAEISFKVVIILCGIFLLCSIGLLAMAILLDKLVYMIPEIFLLLTLALASQFCGNRFIKVVQSTLMLSSLVSVETTRSSSPQGEDKQRYSTRQSTLKASNPAETKMRVKVYLVYIITALILAVGVVLLVNYKAPISSLQPKTPQVYELNLLICLMEILSTFVSFAELSNGSIWSTGVQEDAAPEGGNAQQSKQAMTADGSKAEPT
jgi:hypothetical protein